MPTAQSKFLKLYDEYRSNMNIGNLVRRVVDGQEPFIQLVSTPAPKNSEEKMLMILQGFRPSLVDPDLWIRNVKAN